ncbi:MAG: hypothetical protein WCJ61_08680 [Paludibacter sp.]
MFKQSFYFLLIIIGWSCSSPADSPYDPITFVSKSVMSPVGPVPARASAVAFVIEGYGYVALGRTAVRSSDQYSNSALNDCWQYNPTLDSWTQKSSFPGIPRVNSIAEVINGKAYVGLGYNLSKGVYTDGNLFDLWMYNPDNDSWTKKASLDSLKTTASNACVSFVYNENIYICAGFDGVGFNKEFWKFNPEEGKSGTLTQLNGFPGYGRTGAVICANNEHIYFGTGFNTYNQSDWWEYFPRTDTWKQLKTIPDMGRENATSLCVNNRFFVATGRNFGGNLSGGYFKSDIMEYDVSNNVWYKRGNLPGDDRENAISFSINGKGYIGFGGNDTKVLNDFWSFEP